MDNPTIDEVAREQRDIIFVLQYLATLPPETLDSIIDEVKELRKCAKDAGAEVKKFLTKDLHIEKLDIPVEADEDRPGFTHILTINFTDNRIFQAYLYQIQAKEAKPGNIKIGAG